MESPRRMRESKASEPKDVEERLLSLGALTVEFRSDVEVNRARQQGRELAKRLGCSTFDATLIATVVSELARITAAPARQGKLVLHGKRKNGTAEITILACVQEPGITDPAAAARNGHSNGEGLRLGLRAAKRVMDEFKIVSHPAGGTTVIAQKWVQFPDTPLQTPLQTGWSV